MLKLLRMSQLQQRLPTNKRRAVVTSFDANYFEYSTVLARTLADNFKPESGERLELICLVPLDLAAREEEYIRTVDRHEKLEIQFRSSTSYEELVATGRYNFDRIPHITSNAMQRIFIASTLHEYDDVIYIDPDCMITRDIRPALEYPLVNKFLATVESDGSSLTVFNDPDRAYFGNGVFITSLEYWRAARIEDQMLSYLTSDEYESTACIEQDLMNRFLFDVWSPLPVSFNYRWEFVELGGPFRGSFPLIFHFIGSYKPWINYSDLTSFESAWREEFLKIYPAATFNGPSEGSNDLSAFEESWRQKTEYLFPELSLILKEHKLHE
jgi:lipopolysaccharide biosynthesis glycosyltransferase